MSMWLGLSLILSILLCVHVVRTGREMYWLLIILLLQPLGGLIYLAAIIIPGVLGGSAAQRLGASARQALDPTREYRAASEACEESLTVHNQSRLAAAAAALGRHDEAERLYREAAAGIHAEDPALLLGRAAALIELRRYQEAKDELDRLDHEDESSLTPAAVLALGRANEGLGQLDAADAAYRSALERLPGFEATGRYAAFLARTGRRAEAADMLRDLDRRAAKTNRHFRAEARAWRDLAAEAVKASGKAV